MWIRKNNKEVRWLTKLNLNKANMQNRTKYCRFHEDHRHTIGKCRKLKDEIEILIRDRTLRRFVRKDEDRRSKPRVKTLVNSDENESVEFIHIIARGPNGNKGTNTYRMSLYRKKISRIFNARVKL